MGQPLEIILEQPVALGSEFTINIKYETSENASGLQWLDPQQTEGKKHPYLFSQFQAIHSRSVIPCIDSPSVKQTYSAAVHVPSNLVALMSALPVQNEDTNHPNSTTKTYRFRQPLPIASYLIALAVG